MQVRWLDGVVIAGYFVAIIAIGLRFARHQTSTEAYFVAGRSIPAWAIGLSLQATIISAVTFIAYPGSGYAGNWSMLVPGIMVIVVPLIVGSTVIPFYRRVVGMSAYEYFGRRFGYPARAYSSLAFALGTFAKMAFVIYLLALTVASMTGWRLEFVAVGIGAITVFYTLVGGLEAVIWADVMQGFILWAGVLTCLGYLLFLSPGGASAGLRLSLASNKFSLGSTAFLFSKPTIVVLTVYGFFWYLQKYTADQTMVQRYLAAKTDRDARKAIFLGAAMCIPAWMIFMFIGTELWSFYKSTGEALPAYITKSDQVFPYFIRTHVPAGIAGLIVAALFGAAMATLSSDLNCLATVVVEDFYRHFFTGRHGSQGPAGGQVVRFVVRNRGRSRSDSPGSQPPNRTFAVVRRFGDCHRWLGWAFSFGVFERSGQSIRSVHRDRSQPGVYRLGDADTRRKRSRKYGQIQLPTTRIHHWSDRAPDLVTGGIFVQLSVSRN